MKKLIISFSSDVRQLARQAHVILPSPSAACEETLTTLESSAYYGHDVTLETSQDTTMRSEMLSTVVLQRTNREPWAPVSYSSSFFSLLR